MGRTDRRRPRRRGRGDHPPRSMATPPAHSRGGGATTVRVLSARSAATRPGVSRCGARGGLTELSYSRAPSPTTEGLRGRESLAPVAIDRGLRQHRRPRLRRRRQGCARIGCSSSTISVSATIKHKARHHRINSVFVHRRRAGIGSGPRNLPIDALARPTRCNGQADDPPRIRSR